MKITLMITLRITIMIMMISRKTTMTRECRYQMMILRIDMIRRSWIRRMKSRTTLMLLMMMTLKIMKSSFKRFHHFMQTCSDFVLHTVQFKVELLTLAAKTCKQLFVLFYLKNTFHEHLNMPDHHSESVRNNSTIKEMRMCRVFLVKTQPYSLITK